MEWDFWRNGITLCILFYEHTQVTLRKARNPWGSMDSMGDQNSIPISYVIDANIKIFCSGSVRIYLGYFLLLF